jgi:RNase P/RNase MRP subunit p30
MIINKNNLNEVRKIIQKILKENSKEEIIVKAQDEDFNTKVLEIKGVGVLLSPEAHNRKDYMKQRDSGLNEYLCRLAKKNNIKIGIDLDYLKSLSKKDKGIVLGRIKQNIDLCKRTGTQIVLFPEERYHKVDVISFFTTMGGSTGMGK